MNVTKLEPSQGWVLHLLKNGIPLFIIREYTCSKNIIKSSSFKRDARKMKTLTGVHVGGTKMGLSGKVHTSFITTSLSTASVEMVCKTYTGKRVFFSNAWSRKKESSWFLEKDLYLWESFVNFTCIENALSVGRINWKSREESSVDFAFWQKEVGETVLRRDRRLTDWFRLQS